MIESPVKLYTTQVLGLATSLANWPLDSAMPHQGTARSATCGSQLALSLELDGRDRISALGVSAQACAIGQAAAAVFAGSAVGKDRHDVDAAVASILAWLGDGSTPAVWPGMEALAAARDYPARHGALLLPWKAALEALP